MVRFPYPVGWIKVEKEELPSCAADAVTKEEQNTIGARIENQCQHSIHQVEFGNVHLTHQKLRPTMVL